MASLYQNASLFDVSFCVTCSANSGCLDHLSLIAGLLAWSNARLCGCRCDGGTASLRSLQAVLGRPTLVQHRYDTGCPKVSRKEVSSASVSTPRACSSFHRLIDSKQPRVKSTKASGNFSRRFQDAQRFSSFSISRYHSYAEVSALSFLALEDNRCHLRLEISKTGFSLSRTAEGGTRSCSPLEWRGR